MRYNNIRCIPSALPLIPLGYSCCTTTSSQSATAFLAGMLQLERKQWWQYIYKSLSSQLWGKDFSPPNTSHAVYQHTVERQLWGVVGRRTPCGWYSLTAPGASQAHPRPAPASCSGVERRQAQRVRPPRGCVLLLTLTGTLRST